MTTSQKRKKIHTAIYSLALHTLLLTVLVAAMGCQCNGNKKTKSRTRASKTIKIPSIKEPMPHASKMVMVVIDTLRADRLGCYGYKKQPTTPMIDDLAKESILFEKFYAAGPWTAPSFGTMYTGVSPEVHRNGNWLMAPEPGSVQHGVMLLNPLSQAVRTMAELFDEFDTAAFVTNGFLHSDFGYARGFDYYNYNNGELFGCRRARDTTSLAIAWLNQHAGSKNLLAVVHYMDPHTAYEPLPELERQFAPSPPPSRRVSSPFALSANSLLDFDPTPEEADYIIGLYNAELRHVDDQLRMLLFAMQRLGLMDDTWLVITSDHGEEHFDHGSFNHGNRYEDEVTRVPLIIRAPGGKWGAGVRVPFSASHVDLLPTFLQWFAKKPPWYLEGKSLVPLMTGAETKNRPCYMECPLAPGRVYYAYFDGRYKIIRKAFTRKTYLYDLQRDPKEQKKLDRKHPKFSKLLQAVEKYRLKRKALIEKLNEDNGDENAVMPEETKGALKEMGYIE